MNKIMIRVLAVATLMSSMSAFAMAENKKAGNNSKQDNTNCAAATTTSPADGQGSYQDEGDQKSERQKLIEQQNKEWLRNLETNI